MIDVLRGADLWAQTWQGGTALLLVAVGLYLPYRAGALNLSAEGTMLLGCYGAVLAQATIYPSPWIGALGGLAAGIATATVLAAVSVGLRANIYVVGIALNFVASGGTVVLTALLYGTAGSITAPGVRPLPTPELEWLGFLPWLQEVASSQSAIAYAAVPVVLAITWWLANTCSGVVVRATGRRPDVTEVHGYGAARTQAAALIVGGGLIGLGGAQLALASTAQYSPDMTAGRGFIALTLIFVARTHCARLIPLAFVFAAFDAIGVNLQSLDLPSELSTVIPYLAVLALLTALNQFHRRGPRTQTSSASVAQADDVSNAVA